MQISTREEIRERVAGRLSDLGCTVEFGNKGIWASRRSTSRRRLIGWQMCVYCMTVILDEATKTAHLWDAVMERRQGLLAPHRNPIRASDALAMRCMIGQIIDQAGWSLCYGLGAAVPAEPRVFRP